jgi:hypothetical protein
MYYYLARGCRAALSLSVQIVARGMEITACMQNFIYAIGPDLALRSDDKAGMQRNSISRGKVSVKPLLTFRAG